MTAATAGRGGSALYTPELLGLAVSLAQWPVDPSAPLCAEARSQTCGSTVRFACSVASDGRIEHSGVHVMACAVGQAAAALFIASANGRSRTVIEAARDELGKWLAGEGESPDWPGLTVLDSARAYPARHGAIMLAWDAALAALPKETSAS